MDLEITRKEIKFCENILDILETTVVSVLTSTERNHNGYIEDDVNVASCVRFINHDASCWNAYRNAGLKGILQAEKVGSIILKNNCFIGAESIVLPNIVIGKNSILGAGSVVTKSIPDNEVWGDTSSLSNVG